jgi:inosine-uridine nucleoside N-ribohydrolase
LVAALEQGPLTVVALGPLTNLAAVLAERPALRSRVARLVAVMGRRPGHIFHPAEGAHAGTLFGHGPVFRDFNFAMDARAAAQIVALNLPTSLIPYDAARGVEITAGDLDRLAESGGTTAWVAERARPWLGYWNEDIGRRGFYPFDLLAAAYVVEPGRFRCAPVQLRVGEDPTLFVPFWRPTALLVGQGEVGAGEPRVDGSALYCAKPTADLKRALIGRFGG